MNPQPQLETATRPRCPHCDTLINLKTGRCWMCEKTPEEWAIESEEATVGPVETEPQAEIETAVAQPYEPVPNCYGSGGCRLLNEPSCSHAAACEAAFADDSDAEPDSEITGDESGEPEPEDLDEPVTLTRRELYALADRAGVDPFTGEPRERRYVQLTLDEQYFPLIQNVRVNFSGGMVRSLADLREYARPVGLNPGHDIEVTMTGYIAGVGLKFSPEGSGKAGSLNIVLTDLLNLVVEPTQYAAKEKAEGNGKPDVDEAPAPEYGEDFDPSLCPPQEERLPGLDQTEEASGDTDGGDGDTEAEEEGDDDGE